MAGRMVFITKLIKNMLQKNEKQFSPEETSLTTPPRKRGIFDPSIIEHRERLAAAKPLIEPADVPFFDIIVPVHHGIKIPVRIYLPKHTQGIMPTLFYIPGTAFIAHEVKFTRVICSHIAEKAKCQVIVINHRLAPENPFPEGFLDVYAVFKFFVQKMPERYLIHQEQIAIAGYSSGGNFAALMAIQAAKENIPIARQILISPLVDLSRSLKGFEIYENQDKAISQEFVNFFLTLYIPEQMDAKNPRLSPFWEKNSACKNLPKTDIILAQYDRFRSDAEYYAAKLEEAGVAIEKLVAYGEDHSYLWYKLEVIEKIAERLTLAFRPETIPQLIPSQHTISRIRPQLKPVSKQTQEEESATKSPLGLQAKL